MMGDVCHGECVFVCVCASDCSSYVLVCVCVITYYVLYFCISAAVLNLCHKC